MTDDDVARGPGVIVGKLGVAMRVVTWNVEWAAPRSRRAAEILSRIERLGPEVVCLTETGDALLSDAGCRISSQPDYGYAITAGRRKVMLWSREPWERVDDVGLASMPPGRFVSGVTKTSIGEVTVVGVCIPWSGSRTEPWRGQERRGRWEDHERYLAGLAEVLARIPVERRIIAGDFNQTVGFGSRAPQRLGTALLGALRGMTIATSDVVFDGRRSIDHIALSADLMAGSTDVVSNAHGATRLSDHFGVVVDVVRRA